MELSWFEGMIYGLLSGLAEFLPVSSDAHQALMYKLFGVTNAGNFLQLLVHGSVLIGLYLECRNHIGQLRRERRLAAIPKRRRKRQPDFTRLQEYRLLRSALIPVVLGFFFYNQLLQLRGNLLVVCGFLVGNGLILYLPQTVRSGNKDARSMTGFDGILLGICAGFSLIPGLSTVGLVASIALMRGVDKECALRWALLLCIPVMVGRVGFDVFGIISGGIGSLGFSGIIGCALAAVCAFFGVRLAIRTMRSFARRLGFSGCSYYCWGTALFAFIMYLSI
jgi:undecaprenyl-diphosphatase